MRRKLLLSLGFLFAFVALHAQDITMTGGKMTLRDAFELIERQSGKHIAYNEGVLNVSAKITTPDKTLSLENALNEILRQVDAGFTIDEDLIVIKKNEKKKVYTYTGQVLDEQAMPVPGVYVYLENTTYGTVTDDNGNFQIEAARGTGLKFTSLGFKEKTVKLGTQAGLTVTLEADNMFLNDAVVIGYGSIKRKDLTTAVSVVSTKDLSTRPVISAGTALQGKAAGVQVIQPSGMPGSAISIRVRGATSVQASNEPLYVVDGIPTDDISNIAADDIASLQVLKDASSSAIYGARAANGVVLITTKRGDAGKVELKFNSFLGFSKLGRRIDALNTEEYKELMKELASKTVTVPTIPDEETRYTDWTDVLFGTGVNQNYQLSISNGNDKLRYHVSAGHTSDKGIVNKAYFQRTNFRANVDSDMFKWLTTSFSVGYSHNQGRSVYESRSSLRAGSILSAINTPPFMQIWSPTDPTIYDEDAIWGSSSAWALASFLGRANYNFDDRYLLSANVRFDGSSRFAPGHRWGCFPSLSAAWRISNEGFMEQSRDVVDDLKIRAGYGLTGNQGGIGNYAYLASMKGHKVPPTADNSYPGLAITPNSASNPELTWEKTTQYNIGLDLSLFGSRIMFTTDWYYKKTDDLLLTVSLPDNVNLPGGITRNDGQMENKGAEFVLSTQNLTGDFKWNTDFNLSFNKNKLLKLGLNKVYHYAEMYTTGESAIILKEGLPLGSFYGYKSLGVNVDTGDIDYEDISKNGSIGPEDRTIIGCAQPKFIYGITNDFSWKGLTLSIFFQGSYGNEIFNASRIDTEGMVDFKNQSKTVLNRWKRPGMITDVPRSGNVENIHNSSRFVEDGSYLRLKTLTLSYSLPASLLRKTALSGLQVFVTGQNLLTFTKYTGYDPEVNAYGASSVALGVDYGTYPQSKTVIAGINISF